LDLVTSSLTILLVIEPAAGLLSGCVGTALPLYYTCLY